MESKRVLLVYIRQLSIFDYQSKIRIIMTKKFSVLPQDASHLAIETASGFLTTNSAGVSSPFNFTGTITPITIPDNCAEIIIAPSTDLRVSEDPIMASYYVIVAGSCEAIALAYMPTIYIAADGAGGTANIRFATV